MGAAGLPTVFFITHPDVMIDPAVPVPDWPLNLRGRSRTQALATALVDQQCPPHLFEQ